MGKINGCLKCLFIFFNVLFLILGILIVVAAVKVQEFANLVALLGLPSGWTAWLWVFAIGMLLVSVFGIVAGCLEREIVLKVFAGICVVGILIMLIIGIIIAAKRNQMKNFFEGAYEGQSERMADEDFRKKVEDEWQPQWKCCGVRSYKDWEKDIPMSCACSPPANCMDRPADATGPQRIYATSCGQHAWGLFDWLFKIPMGVFFTLASTTLLGLLVSLLMIRMVRRHDSATGGQNIAMKGSGY